MVQTPIAKEDTSKFCIFEWKNWRDFPHKRWERIITDDNWVVIVSWVFDDGSVSLCSQKILTPKRAKQKGSFRWFNLHRKQFRFNNHLKIFINSALLLGDWEKAYILTYGRQPKDLKEMLNRLNVGGEDFLMKQIDELLDEHGVTDSYVLGSLKDMADGKSKDDKGDLTKDRTIKDTTRAQILMWFAKALHIDPSPQPIHYEDNRKVELNVADALKQLKEKN